MKAKNVSVVRKLLKQYGSDPFVRKNPDDTELPALRSSNQIGILETIELHPRINFYVFTHMDFLSAILGFHVPA